MSFSRVFHKIRWAMPSLFALCAASMVSAGAISSYVLPSYKLTGAQEAQFSRNGQMSPFWQAWDASGNLDYIDMTPAQNGWVDGANYFSGTADAELKIHSAYGTNALYLMFEITDNAWQPPAGFNTDGLDILLDKNTSEEIMNPDTRFDLYIQPSWFWTLTYYTVQYQVNVGAAAGALASYVNFNYFSGSAMTYQRVSLMQLPTEYDGWDLDMTQVSSTVRRMEWKIPWTWVGCGGGIGVQPAVGTLFAMSGGYNDADSPTQTGRKCLRWREQSPFDATNGTFSNAWGDIQIVDQSLDTTGFIITAPTAGAVWIGGMQKTINWTTRGSFRTVTLAYTTNDGIEWTNIGTGAISNTGSYSWTVPATLNSRTCRIKVADYANPMTASISSPFTITSRQSITVTSPNGGETWTAGTTQYITWSSIGIIPTVKIEITSNDGIKWTTVASRVSDSGFYAFTVPYLPSSLYRIRVSDTTAGGALDMSNATFTVQSPPAVTLLTPNGGERVQARSTIALNWNTTGTIGFITLEYTLDGWAWQPIASSLPNTGSYNWVVPNTGTSTALIRISESTSGSPMDASDGYFTILPGPSITVGTPNGGEHWGALTTRPITWTSTGAVGNVNIDLSINNATAWTTLATNVPNNGTYSWVLPNTPAQSCRVRIRQITDTTVCDTGNAPFTIDPQPILSLTSPNGGESYAAGTAQMIVWATTGLVPTVRVDLSRDSGRTWVPVVTSLQNTGYCTWIVPDSASTAYKIRVSDAVYGTPVDQSDKVFTVTPAPTLGLTSPIGGELWNVGSQRCITWISKGAVGTIKIEYSINTGATWSVVAASAPNTGTYHWIVPNVISRNCKVRISDAVNGSPVDMSDSLFVIAPANIAISRDVPKITTMGTVQHDRRTGMVSINVGQASTGYISAVIFGPDGRLIRRIDVGTAPAGYYSLHWDGRNMQGQAVRNGFYQVKIQAGNRKFIKPLVMTR